MRPESIVLMALAAVLVFAGCASQQQGMNYVYVCPDGTQVANLSLCKAPDTNLTSPPSPQKPEVKQQEKPKKNQTASKPPKNQTKQKANQTADNGAPMDFVMKVPTNELNSQMAGNTILGRPTDTDIDVSVLAVSGMQAYAEYGLAPGAHPMKTDIANSYDGKPIVLAISNLQPDTEYYYRVQYKRPNETSFAQTAEGSFHTQRKEGKSFSFAVQADPHRDGHTDENVYRATLQNELAAKPDFLIDLGDTFMTEKFATNDDEVQNRYLQDRGFFGIVAGSAPLFLVNGNHDGEQGYALDGTANNDAVWATMARKEYFLPPYPGSFYSGSNASEQFVGVRGSYYAWQWGDALFLVLDPYWYTKTDPKQSGNNWGWTLGDEQYGWLERTLQGSGAKYKFVFAHHLMGDLRGSIYWAPYYEWGGKNRDGSWGFAAERPGWSLPIHQLMVKNNVTIFFQGHDHMFDRSELDGITYQEVPQPGSRQGESAPGAEYNYNGTILPSSGFLFVSVNPGNVTVEYRKTVVGEGSGANQDDLHGWSSAYSYAISK